MSIREAAGGRPARPDRPDRDTIEHLLLEVVRCDRPLRKARLATICEEHPEQGAALRRRFAFLHEAGLLDPVPPAEASANTAIPERLGGYRLLRQLGRGGMGVVYLAEQESLGRQVALKVIHPGAATPPRARERFRREVQAVSLLDHPNICPVHDAGEIDGVPYLAMRYVEGETLADRIARRHASQAGVARPATDAAAIDELVAMGEELARALHAAHEKGLVHRDVKPGNVMLEAATGNPLLLDFGLAQLDDPEAPTLTLSGDRLGTPTYMAPEQVAGQSADRRADVYALGATLYEALTGRPPHEAPTREALYRRILTAPITEARRQNPRVSRDLDVVLATALDRDPDRRYRTAADFADDFGRLRRHEPIRARPPSRWLRARRWCTRNPGATTTLVVLALGLLATLLQTGKLNRALRERDSTIRIREALDSRAGNPVRSLGLALENAERDGSPAAVAAVRAALHAPQLEETIPSMGRIGQAFDATDDGGRIAWSTTDQQVWLRDGTGTRLLGELPGGMGSFCLRLSPDGERVAVAGNDGPALVFDLQGKVLHTLRPPGVRHFSERTFSVAWHPDGTRLAVGTGTGQTDGPKSTFEVYLWDLADAEKPVWSRPVGAWPWHLTFLDKQLIVAPGAARHPWYPGFELATCAFSLDGEVRELHREHELLCMEMAVADGLVATVGHDCKLVVVDAEGARTSHEHGGRIYTVDVSPDGQRLLTACADGFVRLFDRRANLLDRWRPCGAVPVVSAIFAPDGDAILVRLAGRGRRLMTTDGRLLAELPASTLPVRAERFLAYGRLLTWQRDGARIWRLAPRGLLVHAPPPAARPILSPDGSRILTVDAGRTAELREWGGGPIWSWTMPSATYCVDAEGRAYGVDDNGRQLIIRGPDSAGEPVAEQRWGAPIFNVSCAPEGGLVAVSPGSERLAVVVRQPDGSWRSRADTWLPDVGSTRNNATTPAQWLREGDGLWRLVLGARFGVLEYVYRRGKLEPTEAGEETLAQRVHHLAMTTDGGRLAVSYGERGLRLYGRDGSRWREAAEPLPFTVPIVHLAFAGDLLLATSVNGVRIFDSRLGLVGSLPQIDPNGFRSAHGLPDGEKVLTISADYVMREWWLDDRRVLVEASVVLQR